MTLEQSRYLQGFGYAAVMLGRGDSVGDVIRWALDFAQTRSFQQGMFHAVSVSYGW